MTRATAGRVVGALVVVLGVAALLAGPAVGRPLHARRTAAAAQVDPSSTLPAETSAPTTQPELLQGTPTTASTTTTTTEVKSSAVARADRDNRRVWYVVGGLGGVAVLLLLLTIYYWFRTKPSRVAARAPATPSEPTAAVDEPAAEPVRKPGPLAEDDGGPATEAVPAAVGGAVGGAWPPRAGRPVGRSVAGLDHSGSDDDWSPRGTGEHERVEPTAVPRSARPSRAARQAVLRPTPTEPPPEAD